jgi:GT2 family glycosyltransferase
MYLEDVDLCLRIKNMKKKIFFTTNTSVIHHKAQSSKRNRFVAKQASYQSKIYFYEKNNGLSKKYILKLFIIISAYLELLYLIILYHSSDRVDRIFMQRKVIKCTV